MTQQATPVASPSASPSLSPSASPSPSVPDSPTQEEIAAAAKDLNSAVEELGEAVTVIENFLDRRNIGVPAWVKVKGWEDDGGQYWKRELGYDSFSDSWHIGIRETSGHEAYPEHERVNTWPFHASPRKARISAVDKIPELLTELVKEAERTARRLREKTAEVQAFAATLKITVPSKKAAK